MKTIMSGFILLAALGFSGSAGVQADAKALVGEAQKLLEAGRIEDAVRTFHRAVAADPKLFDAHYGLGRALDLAADYAGAREHFAHAIELAKDDERLQAWTGMAIAYAFAGDADNAALFYQKVFDAQMEEKRADAAAGTANALGRVYLEVGGADKAEEWYRTGYETARGISSLTPAERDLWEYRWEHAQARIAARRGQRDNARQHARRAGAILEKGTNEDQRIFHPYLLGYLAFYADDHAGAISELLKGDQEDPFVLGLIAQAYEKQGNEGKAREYYEKVMASSGHSLNAAFSRRLARGFLGRR
jgi:tetratricopeptide (TPR) repeat protein